MKTRLLITLIALLTVCLAAVPAFCAATITIVNVDGPGEGFNDATPAAPVGGNSGTTIGQQRLIAFQAAASIWGAALNSSVEIRVQANFDPLPCNFLGAAGPTFIVSDFPGATFARTWYPVALANKLAGEDLVPNADDIVAVFNSNVGTATCPDVSWYYGLDGNTSGDQSDLVAVLLHELGHGLGFVSFVNEGKGTQIRNRTDVFSRNILDVTSGFTWDQMNPHQRKLSAINTRNLVWNGAGVTAAAAGVLELGVPQLVITAPVSIAGTYDLGRADFGAPLTGAGVTGDVVAALDAANTDGPSSTDACTAIMNPSEVSGKIALVDRGTCVFTVKVENVQNAGAIGAIIVDHTAGTPALPLSGSDPSITIPAGRVTLADGTSIKNALTLGTVTATLGLDTTHRAGVHPSNRKALLYSPNPVAPGSSISHWDFIAFPNQLMEPFETPGLSHSVDVPEDLTLTLLKDLGW